MIVFNDGTWLCGEDEMTLPDGAIRIDDNSNVAQKIMQYERVQLLMLENATDIQVKPVIDRCSEIFTELEKLDLQAVRPMRAIMAGTATDIDKQKLTAIEEQASRLREELANIIYAEEAERTKK